MPALQTKLPPLKLRDEKFEQLENRMHRFQEPLTRVCRSCSRDVENGKHCICVASKPWFTQDAAGVKTTFKFNPTN